jgi:cytidine deaminase
LKHDAIDSELADSAKRVLPKAYAPYSGLRVGAAVRARSGAVFCGVNVENASFGLTMCAERAAICNAVVGGERNFESLALVSDGEEFLLPCGACRQVLAEFASDLVIYSLNGKGESKRYVLSEIFPQPFGRP